MINIQLVHEYAKVTAAKISIAYSGKGHRQQQRVIVLPLLQSCSRGQLNHRQLLHAVQQWAGIAGNFYAAQQEIWARLSLPSGQFVGHNIWTPSRLSSTLWR